MSSKTRQRMIRLDDRTESGTQIHSRTCEGSGCRKTTRAGKPYCPDHVEDAPYVKLLMQRQRHHALLEDTARQGKKKTSEGVALNAFDVFANSLAHILRSHGPATIERLAKESCTDKAAVETYVGLMVSAARAKLKQGRRAEFVVLL